MTPWTLGNHEFNFGRDIFTGVLGQATFPILAGERERRRRVRDRQRAALTSTVRREDRRPGGDQGRDPGHQQPPRPQLRAAEQHPRPDLQRPAGQGAGAVEPACGPTNDVVVALTHIGFTENPASVEVDNNVDTNMAMTVTGLDAIIGGHSHTNPATGFGDYKYLPTIVPDPNRQTGAHQPGLSLQQHARRDRPRHARQGWRRL